MATSGTYNYLTDFSIVNAIDEGFRRIKVDPASITEDQKFSARISINLMLTDWANDGNQQFSIDQQTQNLVVDDSSFQMPVGSIDVLDMVYRFNEQDIQILPISRSDYLDINNKFSTGQPVCYFVDKTAMPPTVFLWPIPNISNSQVVYNRLKRAQDAGRDTNNPDITLMYMEAFCAGLAAKLAEKYAEPAMESMLLAKAAAAYKRANDQDRDRAPYVMRPRLGRRTYYGV